ncbi:MAG TPA: dihydrolipoamide acetyltransferase family protein [Chloroflexota bacterium]|jgi:pyruvate dehydrogenase E2 component (dihydrolipoamide acetyltransferase)|nr:dihydrolipoamide acetyltransferase family protein [Chloroflexota bacterium]
MPFEFKLPDLGEGIHEAQLLTWKVSPGQDVSAFQALCEVESAKAAVELTAPVAGRVLETRFREGDTARLGDVLVVIDTNGGSTAAESAEVAPPEEWFGIVGSRPVAETVPTAEAPRTAKHVQAAPFVRKLARERGIRLEDINGSGPHGRVRIADLDAQAAQKVNTADRIPLRGIRKSIADHMVEAWRNAPQVTSMDLLDVTELVRARELLLAAAQAEGARLTYLPFFVKATIEALKAVPEANAIVADDAIVLKREFHIGIATAIEGGLVVPVLRHADCLNLIEIAAELQRLIGAARERRASPAELSGSTFTITNFGGLPGSPLFATPILNYPEVAILGLGRIDLQPRVVDGQVVARHCVGVSFTFDHRVLDGENAGRFMAALKRFVEQPLELLLKLR